MKKEFISYEQALALKELEFDEPCLGWYLPEIVEKGNMPSVILGAYITNWTKFGDRLSAPTYSQAFRWFREKYKMAIINPDWNNKFKYKVFNLHPLTQGVLVEETGFQTYEEAEQACLNKLIEIVKP